MKEKEDKEVPIFIEGENICFIPYNSEYINLYVRWANDHKVRKYARTILPVITEEIKKWFESPEKGIPNFIGFVIWHKKDKKPIGSAEISLIDWVNSWANLGIAIGEPAYWNKNIATEATELLIEYAFNELNLNKLRGCAAIENIGSWSVAEKLGFIFEGLGKHEMYVDGNYLDEKIYCLLREDWLNFKNLKNK